MASIMAQVTTKRDDNGRYILLVYMKTAARPFKWTSHIRKFRVEKIHTTNMNQLFLNEYLSNHRTTWHAFRVHIWLAIDDNRWSKRPCFDQCYTGQSAMVQTKTSIATFCVLKFVLGLRFNTVTFQQAAIRVKRVL